MDLPAQPQQNPPGADAGQTIFLERPPLTVPLNLADWVEPEKIVRWIQEALTKLDTSKPEVRSFLSHRPEERPELLLSVLVFAYATQRYSSGEIVRACHLDPILMGLCQGQAPFTDELEHFRRTHRVVLELVLGQIFVRAVQEKFLDTGQLPPGLQHGLFGCAVDQIDAARHMSTWDE